MHVARKNAATKGAFGIGTRCKIPCTARLLHVVLVLFTSIGFLSATVARAQAQSQQYSETFTNGQGYFAGSSQYDNWASFRAALPATGMSDITVKGSLDAVGRTCSDPVKAQQIADAIRAGATGVANSTATLSINCDGFLWQTGSCSGNINDPNNLALSVGPGGICSCDTKYTVRPGILNGNWGGVGGATCGAPTQTLTVVANSQNTANTRQKTLQTIQRFLKRRNDLLLSNGPDLGRQIDRLRSDQTSENNGTGFVAHNGKPDGVSFQAQALGGGGSNIHDRFSALGGPLNSIGKSVESGYRRVDRVSSIPLGFQVNATSSTNLSFATSLAEMAKSMAETKRRKLAGGKESLQALGIDGVALVQPNTYVLDLWVQGNYTSFDEGAAGGKSDGRFGVLYVGMDYVLSPGILVGALFQFDNMKERSADLGTATEGSGWMAGPYITVRATDHIFVQARAAWGSSNNNISPFLTYVDNFGTQRWLVEGNVQGRWTSGNWSFNPKASIAFIEEDQDGYTDSLGFVIPGQIVKLGQARFGPRIGYLFKASDGTQFEPFVGFEGIWNFEQSGTNLVAATLASQDDVRGKVDVGIRALTVLGLGMDISASYDGIGAQDFDAFTGEVRLRFPLH